MCPEMCTVSPGRAYVRSSTNFGRWSGWRRLEVPACSSKATPRWWTGTRRAAATRRTPGWRSRCTGSGCPGRTATGGWHAVRRRALPPRPGGDAGLGTRAAAGRAHQRPGRPGGGPAGGTPAQAQRHGCRRHPRPALPRPAHHHDPGGRLRQGQALRQRLRGPPGRQGGGTAAQAAGVRAVARRTGPQSRSGRVQRGAPGRHPAQAALPRLRRRAAPDARAGPRRDGADPQRQGTRRAADREPGRAAARAAHLHRRDHHRGRACRGDGGPTHRRPGRRPARHRLPAPRARRAAADHRAQRGRRDDPAAGALRGAGTRQRIGARVGPGGAPAAGADTVAERDDGASGVQQWTGR